MLIDKRYLRRDAKERNVQNFTTSLLLLQGNTITVHSSHRCVAALAAYDYEGQRVSIGKEAEDNTIDRLPIL